MTKYIKYHKNYTEFGEPYQLVLPLNLEGLVPDDDSVRLLSHELEDLDYSLLYQAYSTKGRNPAVDPKTMFKILTYAYSQNIYSCIVTVRTSFSYVLLRLKVYLANTTAAPSAPLWIPIAKPAPVLNGGYHIL